MILHWYTYIFNIVSCPCTCLHELHTIFLCKLKKMILIYGLLQAEENDIMDTIRGIINYANVLQLAYNGILKCSKIP